jgi:hypothetical protein
MNHPDWEEAMELLMLIRNSIVPRLSQLRANAFERLDEHRRLDDYPEMHSGRMSYPDEWPHELEVPVLASRSQTEEEPYVLDAPNTRIGRMLVELYGGDDESEAAAKTVAETLTEFEEGQRKRQDALAFVRKELNSFQAGAYERTDVVAFVDNTLAALVPGALEWQDVLIFVNRAMEKFDPGARERQEILAWLYLKTGKRPDALIIPGVGQDEYGRLEVRLGNLVIFPEPDDAPEESVA